MLRRSLFAVALGCLLLLASAPSRADDMDERLRACAACHGEQGRAQHEQYYPSIAGKPAAYLHNQLLNFRDGRRHNAVMERMLAVLSDDYLAAMAAYYAQQAPVAHQPFADATAAQLELGGALARQGDAAREVPACVDCHGDQLQGDGRAVPALTGLKFEYLTAQFGAWRTGTREAMPPDCMATIARRLTDAQVAAVSAWIASRPASSAPAQPRPPERWPLDCGGVP